jgi:hypothetical protein
VIRSVAVVSIPPGLKPRARSAGRGLVRRRASQPRTISGQAVEKLAREAGSLPSDTRVGLSPERRVPRPRLTAGALLLFSTTGPRQQHYDEPVRRSYPPGTTVGARTGTGARWVWRPRPGGASGPSPLSTTRWRVSCLRGPLPRRGGENPVAWSRPDPGRRCGAAAVTAKCWRSIRQIMPPLPAQNATPARYGQRSTSLTEARPP